MLQKIVQLRLPLFRPSNSFWFSTSQDFYTTLCVSTASTNEEIKQAYVRLTKLYHPDVSKTKEAEDRFKLITEAYRKLSEERNRETQKEEQLRQKYHEYLKSQNQQSYVSEFAKEEFRIFQEIFRDEKYDFDTIYSLNNEQRRKLYEERLAQLQKLRANEEKKFQEFKAAQFQSQTARRVVEDQKVPYNGRNQDNFNKNILVGISVVVLSGIFLFFPKKYEQTDQATVDRMRKVAQEKKAEKVNKVLQSLQDNNMLKYGTPEPDCFDILNKFTIYSDLKMYWVKPKVFQDDEQKYVQSDDFEKYPMVNESLATRVTHALECERILQNIYVKVSDVLDQIKETGQYTPPGFFMRYYGYVYFRIRDKPIIVENLINAKQMISIFDLYFRHPSPIPFLHNRVTEFRLNKNGLPADINPNAWVGNARLSVRAVPIIHLKGKVKNVVVTRNKLNYEDDQRYRFAWGNRFILMNE